MFFCFFSICLLLVVTSLGVVAAFMRKRDREILASGTREGCGVLLIGEAFALSLASPSPPPPPLPSVPPRECFVSPFFIYSVHTLLSVFFSFFFLLCFEF